MYSIIYQYMFTISYQYMYTISYHYRAQNLRKGIVMKTSFETRVSRMGLGSFVDINIFVVKYYFIKFLHK